MLRNDKGDILISFCKPTRIRDCNEMEVIAILEALTIHFGCFHGSLMVENDSSNDIAWALREDNIPWKFHYLLNKIRSLSSSIKAEFKHINRLVNILADSLAKQGVDRETLSIVS